MGIFSRADRDQVELLESAADSNSREAAESDRMAQHYTQRGMFSRSQESMDNAARYRRSADDLRDRADDMRGGR